MSLDDMRFHINRGHVIHSPSPKLWVANLSDGPTLSLVIALGVCRKIISLLSIYIPEIPYLY